MNRIVDVICPLLLGAETNYKLHSEDNCSVCPHIKYYNNTIKLYYVTSTKPSQNIYKSSLKHIKKVTETYIKQQ